MTPPESRRLDGELSLIIPAFNEESRIQKSLESILRYFEGRFEHFEILVIDDGSNDRTTEIVRSLDHPSIRCLNNERNAGKGYSVRRGMLAAQHDPVLFTDADLSTPIEELEALLEEIRKGSDVAIASRWCQKGQEVQRKRLRRLLGRGFAFVVHVTTLGKIRDTQCGFKMFRQSVVEPVFTRQTIDGWGFDVEILFIAQKMGFKIKEVPVRWFQSGESKLKLSATFTMTWDLIRIHWNNLRGKYKGSPTPKGSALADHGKKTKIE